ncbi:DMT family transporter [Nioella nitratireducens]|uniref:DMT family transporter n=1 Tax=Nioella nitratireducens TaxID=1287720 RepID=UPI001F311E20|nr:DMT family transporter [Nioella nitratireducens]
MSSAVIGMGFFVVQDGMMKDLLHSYTVWELILTRGLMAALLVGPLILWLGHPHRLLTPLWPLHLLRAVLLASGFAMFYAAFPFMGLAEVSTIFFSAPLLIALLAAVWLRESIGPHRMVALAVGFVGVVIAMTPSGEAFNAVAILPLLCALFYAIAQILARRIGDRETTLTTALYTLVFSAILIVPFGWLTNQIVAVPEHHTHLLFTWVLPPGWEAGRLALLGAVGILGYMALTRAYQVTSASLVAPFDYSYLPIATVMAYVLWGEVPRPAILMGMSLIITSGLYLGYRELRTSRATPSPLPVAESSVAPGNPIAPMTVARDVDAEGPGQTTM